MHSRQRASRTARPRAVNSTSHFLRALRIAAALAALVAPAASAQRGDSARVAARPPVDTSTRPVLRPPISPRRAFLSSLLLPGYSQSVLGRPTAGALFVISESIGIALLREAQASVAEARALRTDSTIVIGATEQGVPITRVASYRDELIRVRRGHVEDWIAFLIANHLFAAADGYVGANLWDLPSQVSVRREPGRTVLAARLSW